MSQLEINQYAEQLLLAVKMEQATEEIEQNLSKIKPQNLFAVLSEDQYKKAFWINIYNAFFQILRKRERLKKPEIYRGRFINIAGDRLSLDDIEHGILRRFRSKLSLGYLPNLLTEKRIKDLAVKQIDYRIHFALNCGAASCPPIAFYAFDKIEYQLELAMLSYLESETTVDEVKQEIQISRLFQWYQGDFGGKRNIRKIIQDKLKIDTAGFTWNYRPYSWEEQLNNYSSIGFEVES